MPKETQQISGVPRQRPVSCRFCRTRKLRCSRGSPCSNCVSRGITCELEQPINTGRNTDDDGDKAELLERIRKLEALVAQSVKSSLPSTPRSTLTLPPDPRCASLNGNASNTFRDVSNDLPGQTIPPSSEQLDLDFAWLESIYDDTEHASDAFPSTKIGLRICSFRLVAEVEQFITGTSSSDPSIIFWLPEYNEARILLDKFVDDIEHLSHIVLTQSLLSTLDHVYSSVTKQEQIKSGELILLLSIFAAAMRSWKPEDCQTRGMFTTCADPHRRSALWVKATEDLLDIAHRTTRISIEGIQGIVIVMFVAANWKGFSRRCWFLMNHALLLAREIGLHYIDHPCNASLANTAQAEVGRRVWWYLVASDWGMATRFNGLARGTYHCHKRQMMTHKPLNLDDEDVVDGMALVGKPLSQPTQMSYFIFRIRLHEISRSIVDRTPLLSSPRSGPGHEVVMDIDTEMQELYNSIPDYFSMTPTKLAEAYNMPSARARTISRQGNDLHTFFHAIRCKLHLPYARRGFTELDYATSRDLCIQSARLIIQTEHEYQRAVVGLGFRIYKPLLYSITVFLACTVLLMDYCHRKPSSGQGKQRQDICNAMSLLEAARSESEIAHKFLDSMVTVLHRHGIAPPKRVEQPLPTMLPGNGVACPLSSATGNSVPMMPIDGLNMGNSAFGGTFTMAEARSDLNDLVESLDQGVDVGMIEWDDIFNGLGDSSFI